MGSLDPSQPPQEAPQGPVRMGLGGRKLRGFERDACGDRTRAEVSRGAEVPEGRGYVCDPQTLAPERPVEFGADPRRGSRATRRETRLASWPVSPGLWVSEGRGRWR